MTPEKIVAVVTKYRTELAAAGHKARRMDIEKPLLAHSSDELRSHALHLCGNVEVFIEEGRMGKANRHFAWIQACLFIVGDYTVADFMGHNAS